MTNSIYWAAIGSLLLLSAIFSGSETGFYRISRLQSRLYSASKPFRPPWLLRLLDEGRPVVMALLIGNNLVNNALTSLIALFWFGRLEQSYWAEVYAVLMVSPILFIFGEMVPKVLFCANANQWMPKISPLIWFTYALFKNTGVIALLQWLSDVSFCWGRIRPDTAVAVDITQRRQMRQLLHETSEEGLLTPMQNQMMDRLLRISELTIEQLITPLQKVKTIPVNADRKTIQHYLAHWPYTRYPVVEDNQWVGYINIYQTAAHIGIAADLRAHLKPLCWVSADWGALKTLSLMCKQNQKLAAVADKQTRQPIGIITLTDLINALTGLMQRG